MFIYSAQCISIRCRLLGASSWPRDGPRPGGARVDLRLATLPEYSGEYRVDHAEGI